MQTELGQNEISNHELGFACECEGETILSQVIFTIAAPLNEHKCICMQGTCPVFHPEEIRACSCAGVMGERAPRT
jgi:hypothetical protein